MVEKSISPYTYSEINHGIDSQLFLAILFIILGFSVVFLLEKTAAKKTSNGH